MDDNLEAAGGTGTVEIGDVLCWCGKFYLWGLDLLWWLR